MRRSILYLAIITTLCGCGARKTTLETSEVQTHNTGSASSATDVHRTSDKDSTGTQHINLVTNNAAESHKTDTGKVETTSKTVIQAQFAPGEGPTAAEIAAAAGDKAKTNALLNHATGLTITTDGKKTVQKGIDKTKKQTSSADSSARTKTNLHVKLNLDSIARAKEKFTQDSLAQAKKKTTDRKGMDPGIQLALLIGAFAAVCGLAWYLHKKFFP